jgi:hypothetical protein
MDTFIFHHSTYTPAMTYSSCVTTRTTDTLNKIQRKEIAAILEKLGMNQNFPRRVAFGPKELCCLSLLDLSIEQGVRQISHFLDHVFVEDSIDTMILIELRHLQLESGSGSHLLAAPSIRLSYITPCWISSMREFMASHGLQLDVAKAKIVPLVRDHDQYVMDDFRLLPNLTDDDLNDINRVPIFLKVTTLSDIADGIKTHITTDAFEAKQLSDRESPLRWPRQPYVTTRQRNLWKTALKSAYTSWGHKLHHPLGSWTGIPNQTWNAVCNLRACTVTITDKARPIQQYLIHQESRWYCNLPLFLPAAPRMMNGKTLFLPLLNA